MQPTQRFSKTVNDYAAYRPSYPQEVINVLKEDCGLNNNSVIADIGSGTGIFSKLLLEQGNQVYSVEPNLEMQKEAETTLKYYSNFRSINGSAEATTLASNSIDIVTAATAFHWFDKDKSKMEFKRILKSPGWLLLVWNVRDMQNSALLREYEKLIIEYGYDYKNSIAHIFDETVTANFFAPFEMKTKSFPYKQIFDWKGFKGRLLSASYSLREGDARYDDMINGLQNIFDRYQQNQQIEFLYSTKLYYGRLR